MLGSMPYGRRRHNSFFMGEYKKAFFYRYKIKGGTRKLQDSKEH